MITKEIKQKEYLRGTKSARLRNFIGLGMVIMTAIISIPTYKYLSKTINFDFRQSREEEQKAKIKEMFELRSALLEEKEKDVTKLKAPTR
ncbi:hypothetical protein BgiMline_022312 [Biomphalaria glabrata]|nr:hypothetical protein BgiMline_010190 [Biomphalaria glabrata]KAI8798046.1 hypothetical protein BgiBS90_000349 [Biomphalaria glabrata]